MFLYVCMCVYMCMHCVCGFVCVQSYRPVRSMRTEQVLQLGSIITELGERELQALDLSDLGLVAHLGSLGDWSPKKVREGAQPLDALGSIT